MNKPAVFRAEKLQKEFDKNGFVKFRLLSKDQVGRLNDYYFQTQQLHETVTDTRKFHATNDTDNAKLIADADKQIKEVMFEEIDKHFVNYRTIAANYLIKQPSEQSVLGPHQDLKFVDEEKFYSFNLWVATQPTKKINGGLRFLKGSHNFHETVRALPTYPWKYRNVSDLIPQYFTDIETEVGDCVVLNHACIHASYPNLTKEVRIAAILAMIPLQAEIIHYFLPDGNPKNEVEQYAMTFDDFVNLKGGKRPENAPLTNKFKYDFSGIDEKEFLMHIMGIKNENSLILNHGYEYVKQKLSTFFRSS